MNAVDRIDLTTRITTVKSYANRFLVQNHGRNTDLAVMIVDLCDIIFMLINRAPEPPEQISHHREPFFI